jgi:hypothetical protein
MREKLQNGRDMLLWREYIGKRMNAGENNIMRRKQ